MKKIIGVVSLVVIMLVGVVACSPNIGDELKLSENLGYSEAVARESIAQVRDILFAKDGESSYKIVLPSDASGDLRYDADFLKDALNRIVNNGERELFEVVDTLSTGVNIYLGDTVSIPHDKTGITDDGFSIKIDEGGIFIFAKNEEGISNGIYTFLEDYLECMFAREDFSYYPYFPTIYFEKSVKISNPDFAWRKVYTYETIENKWFRRLKANGTTDETQNIENHVGWGTWCHNVFTFVDPKLYFETHPEYFAMLDGERRTEFNGQDTQLCLTNENIYPIIEAKMAEFMREQPEDKYWDFSINDNRNACQCENCTRVASETGSMMGTMLPIINKLARKFPDKIISTLAYFFNLNPPEGIEVESNVNIVIAPIATGQIYSFANPKHSNAKNAADLIKKWGDMADNLLIWDYVINFSHLLLPYPNFSVQRENLEFYKEHSVRAVFHQASRENGDELANLRAYILSRQMWDIDVDINKTLGKYLTVVYGKADKYVAQYLDKAQHLVNTKAYNLDLYDSPIQHAGDYLSTGAISSYRRIIDNAIEAEKDNEVIVLRLEEIKINVLYAKMTENSLDYVGKKHAFEEFSELVVKHGIRRPYEWSEPTMQEFIEIHYPAELAKIKRLAIIVPSVSIPAGLLLFGGATGFIIWWKKRKKKQNCQSDEPSVAE